MKEGAIQGPESERVAVWAEGRIAELMGVINAATAAAFAEGRLTEDAVKLIVARTPPERDAEVADLARMNDRAAIAAGAALAAGARRAYRAGGAGAESPGGGPPRRIPGAPSRES